MSSHQRLLEIEEKRKKRKVMKTQQHFRGSSFGQGSFGQGSVPKTVHETAKSYEYGSNGFVLEESSENVANEELNHYGIDTLIHKINNAISEKVTKPNNKNSTDHK